MAKTKPLNEIDYSIMDKLTVLRKRFNKTRQEVSDDFDGEITVDQLKAYELKSRYSEPSYKHLTMLAEYYGVSTDYLLGINKEDSEYSFDDDTINTLFELKYGDNELIAFLLSTINAAAEQYNDMVAMRESIIDDAIFAIDEAEENGERVPDMYNAVSRSIAFTEQINYTRNALLYESCRLVDDCLKPLFPEEVSFTDFFGDDERVIKGLQLYLDDLNTDKLIEKRNEEG